MNLAHDRAEAERMQWVEELCEYAQTDLLCYRAEEAALREKQAHLWNPVLERLAERHALKFVCGGNSSHSTARSLAQRTAQGYLNVPTYSRLPHSQ